MGWGPGRRFEPPRRGEDQGGVDQLVIEEGVENVGTGFGEHGGHVVIPGEGLQQIAATVTGEASTKSSTGASGGRGVDRSGRSRRRPGNGHDLDPEVAESIGPVGVAADHRFIGDDEDRTTVRDVKHPGGRWKGQIGVQHDAARGSASPNDSRIQAGVIGQDGSDAREDGIHPATFPMDEAMRRRTRDGRGGSRGGDQIAIRGFRPFGDDPGSAGGHPVAEGRMEPPHGRHVIDHHDVDPGGSESCDAACGEGIGIDGAHHQPSDPRGEDGIHAGRSPAVMIAGFERDPGRAAAGGLARSTKGHDLRMRAAGAAGSSASDDPAVTISHEATHGRIGFGISVASQGESGGPGEEVAVVVHSSGSLRLADDADSGRSEVG